MPNFERKLQEAIDDQLDDQLDDRGEFRISQWTVLTINNDKSYSFSGETDTIDELRSLAEDALNAMAEEAILGFVIRPSDAQDGEDYELPTVGDSQVLEVYEFSTTAKRNYGGEVYDLKEQVNDLLEAVGENYYHGFVIVPASDEQEGP